MSEVQSFDGCMDECMDVGCMDGCMGAWMDGSDRWMDACMGG